MSYKSEDIEKVEDIAAELCVPIQELVKNEIEKVAIDHEFNLQIQAVTLRNVSAWAMANYLMICEHFTKRKEGKLPDDSIAKLLKEVNKVSLRIFEKYKDD